MDWPAYSPDLNPIELVWDMLGRRIAARQPPSTCLPELRRALFDEWCNIPQDQIDNLIFHSSPVLSTGTSGYTIFWALFKPAGWHGWFVTGLLHLRLRVRHRPEVLDYHDAEKSASMLSKFLSLKAFAYGPLRDGSHHTFTYDWINVTRTVQRELHASNLYGRVGIRKPLVTSRHALQRRQWCRTHRQWTPQQWQQVIWSDESTSTLFQTTGRVYVWRTPIEAFVPECIVPTVKHGDGSHMSKQRARFPPPSTISALETALHEEWLHIPLQVVRDLYASIPRRIQSVIQSKGGSNSY
ncbi:transposable element Tcb1 transposase [Trichonephila clavipes]|nr:transposable element Tcb1 transposase [Trichonephila clavipes]